MQQRKANPSAPLELLGQTQGQMVDTLKLVAQNNDHIVGALKLLAENNRRLALLLSESARGDS